MLVLLGIATVGSLLTATWLAYRLRTQHFEHRNALHLEQQARTELEVSLHVRDRLMRSVSHDLKNPLHTISLAAQLLEMPLAQEQQRKQIAVIHRTVARADRIVLDLLDAARLQSGSVIPIDPGDVDVQPLLDELREAFELHAAEKQQQLICGEADGVCVRADRARLVRALSNLVGNAVKFTPRGGTITLKVHPRVDRVEFLIRDTGPGIPRHLLPVVFEPFAQAKGTASHGTGLGLAIANGIIRAHGSEISVMTSNEGTTATFVLPRAPHTVKRSRLSNAPQASNDAQ
jgi:signal transduction histidine kinase